MPSSDVVWAWMTRTARVRRDASSAAGKVLSGGLCKGVCRLFVIRQRWHEVASTEQLIHKKGHFNVMPICASLESQIGEIVLTDQTSEERRTRLNFYERLLLLSRKKAFAERYS